MVVQHNLTAMNANRMLGINTATQAKSTEKLSSGYKINRAADDAAGLSISEKMRKQIRGLSQASLNAQDGISAVQTAEGALAEVQDMLQRMNELAVKAANGTNSEDDRNYIQDEIAQLTTEIDRVAETTKFNEAYLLKGDSEASKIASFSYVNYTTAKAATVTGSAAGTLKDDTTGLTLGVTFAATAGQDEQNEIAKALVNQGISVSYEGSYPTDGTLTEAYKVELNGNVAENYTIVAKDKDSFEIQDLEGNKVADLEANGITAPSEGDADISKSAVLSAKSATAAQGNGEVAAYYDKDGNMISANALSNYFGLDSDGNVAAKVDAPDVYDALGNKTTLAAGDVAGKKDITGSLALTLHVGADATSNNQITINIDSMSAKALGVNGLKVNGPDDTNALAAVETIAEAIQKVSTQRSALGAVQNRLEHTINNLDNVVENTTAAESQIRDTDMATEMVKYSNNQILAQAGQAMLAQANQANQGVLSLLQ
ncbi:MAG: hypothetical protein IJ324_05725 [Lachnospiraceae bacterium]|nr:hypothetical protein [Lachnospiraceae bacterium]